MARRAGNGGGAGLGAAANCGARHPAGSRTVRLGWYETMPAGLLTATAKAGRTDLLTVPPQTSEPAAWAAMDQAAQAGNRTHAPALLAAISTAPGPGIPSSARAGGAERGTHVSADSASSSQ